MFFMIDWEGRSYSSANYAMDLVEIKRSIPGKVYFVHGECRGIFTDDPSSWEGITDEVAKDLATFYGNGIETFDPACIPWKKYERLEAFIREEGGTGEATPEGAAKANPHLADIALFVQCVHELDTIYKGLGYIPCNASAEEVDEERIRSLVDEIIYHMVDMYKQFDEYVRDMPEYVEQDLLAHLGYAKAYIRKED